MTPCCDEPSLLPAYIWRWPFKGVYCLCCGEATMTCSRPLEWVFEVFLLPFWDGSIHVMRDSR